MAVEGIDPAELTLQSKLDMRYKGQSHELTIALDGPTPIVHLTKTTLAALFHAAHAARYDYERPDAPVELVTLRLTAVAPVTPPVLPHQSPTDGDPAVALIGRKPVWFDAQPLPTALYDRARLQPGQRFAGPAVLFQYDTTAVVPPQWEVVVDGFGNLVMRDEG